MTLIDTLRGPKFFDMAIFDWVATIAVAIGIWHFTEINFIMILVSLIALAIIMHVAFNVKSKMNYYLGLSEDPRPMYNGDILKI